jgi:hypothetical protein
VGTSRLSWAGGPPGDAYAARRDRFASQAGSLPTATLPHLIQIKPAPPWCAMPHDEDESTTQMAAHFADAPPVAMSMSLQYIKSVAAAVVPEQFLKINSRPFAKM